MVRRTFSPIKRNYFIIIVVLHKAIQHKIQKNGDYVCDMNSKIKAVGMIININDKLYPHEGKRREEFLQKIVEQGPYGKQVSYLVDQYQVEPGSQHFGKYQDADEEHLQGEG